ncbi:hypothetical protein C8Q70DRAFT_419499 [Cubamyces menziesii]|nr:hypothetical protein C8Q70DRAFT_419499 [Cubamyces menziesii]
MRRPSHIRVPELVSRQTSIRSTKCHKHDIRHGVLYDISMSHVCALEVPGHDKCAIAASALVGASGVYLDFILLMLASANALNLWIAAASTSGCSASLPAYSALRHFTS